MVETRKQERDRVRDSRFQYSFSQRIIRDADRLAEVEGQVRETLEALGQYPKALSDPQDVENVRDRLRAIIDAPDAGGEGT